MITIKARTLAVATLAAILGGVGISMAAGWWKTTSTKIPARFAAGEYAGTANPADIRGSYTWRDIEAAFAVPAELAARAFSPAAAALKPEGKVNELEAAYALSVPDGREIGTDSVRLFVALYLGLPYEPEEGTALPAGAIEALLALPGADPSALTAYSLEPIAAARAPVADGSPFAQPAAANAKPAATPTTPTATASAATAAPTATPTATPGAGPASGDSDATHEAPAFTVTGKTTFGELYLWGLDKASVKGAVGFEPGPVSQSVRDAVSAAGGSFAEVKAALQALLDKVKR